MNVDATSPGAVRPGDLLRYTLQLHNSGVTAATNVVVIDALQAAAFSDVTLVTPGERDGDTLRYDSSSVPALALMLPGDEATLVFEARLASDVPPGTRVSNQATVQAPELPAPEVSDDPATSSVIDDATEVTVHYPRLVLVKSVTDLSGGDVIPGDTLHFNLAVTNDGDLAASGVSVRDALDPSLELIEAPGASVAGRVLTWDLGALATGATWTVGVTAKVMEAATHGLVIANQAFARAGGLAEVPSDWPSTSEVGDPVLVQVVARPDLSGSEKTVTQGAGEGGSVAPGTLLTYRIVVPNSGRGPAHHVQVRDRLDGLLELVAMPPGAWVDGDTVVWDITELAVGQSAELSLDVRVRQEADDGVSLANQAAVTANEVSVVVLTDAPTTGAVDDPTVLRVRARPDLHGSPLVVEDVNGGNLQPGDLVHVHADVINRGTAPTAGTAVRLPLPSYTSVVAGSARLNGEPLSDADLAALLQDGVSVRSADVSVAAGVVLPARGHAGQETATIELDLRVDPRALVGTQIILQTTMLAQGLDPARSDNPATGSTEGDPTILRVGGGPELVLYKRAVTESRVVPVGGHVQYVLELTNVGTAAAHAVHLADVVPQGASYVPGTLTLDGSPLSDDAVAVDFAAVEPGTSHVIAFGVRVDAGPMLRNQAEVSASGRVLLSDGDASTPGTQPTLTPVDDATEMVLVDLAATDVDGGLLDHGDAVRYAVTVRNVGALAVRDLAVRWTHDEGLAEVATLAGEGVAPLGEGEVGWTVGELGPGVARDFIVSARVAEHVRDGDTIVATASADSAHEHYAALAVRLLVGSGVGSARAHGRLFFERGERDGQFDGTRDEGAAGFVVLAVPEAAWQEAAGDGAAVRAAAVRAVTTGGDGLYDLSGLPPGPYELVLLSDAGVQYGAPESVTLAAGDALTRERVVDPSGIIYEVQGGLVMPVAGATVYLYDIATGQDLARTVLLAGQQGQVTSAQGYYRFDVRAEALPGSFALRIVPSTPHVLFPSVTRPPMGAAEAEPLGVAATVGSDGRVVATDFPEAGGDPTYYLRFDLDVDTPNIVNNHVPLDRLAERLHLTKSASRRTASVGEVITYNVTIENPTDAALSLDGPLGGVVLVDDLPAGLRWVEGSARVVVAGSEPQRLAAALVTARSVRFVPMTLPAHATIAVRYYAVVGLSATGEQTNRARLVDPGGSLLSNIAQATVRVQRDAIFEQGTVLGQVFCDDGNGVLDPADMGVAGARVYLDSGYYVDTDVAGKFHVRGVDPGRHAVKLDVNTLPPGSLMVSDALRELRLTPGLLAKVDFAVRCGWSASAVELLAAPAAATATVAVVVDPSVPAVAIDGKPQSLPHVDALLGYPDGVVDFADGRGLTVSAPLPLRWSLRVPDDALVARWQISFFDPDEREVWRIEGQGRPPDRLPWTLPADASPFVEGTLYHYRLAVEMVGGDLGEGRWRLFGFGVQVDGQRAVEETWEGELFSAEDAPTAAAEAKVRELAARLVRETGDWNVMLEAHVAPGGRRSAALLTSQRQAAALAKLLIALGVPKERVRAIGKGDMGWDARRVVVSIERDPREAMRLAALSYPGWLNLGDARTVALAADGSLTVDLREDSGRRVRIVRRAPWDGDDGAKAAPVAVPIAGSLAAGQLDVGGVSLPIPALAARCLVAPQPARLAADGLETPLVFSIEEAGTLDSWSVRLLNADGTVLKELAASGTEPITWDGRTASGHSALVPGGYTYRCMLVGGAGNRALLPVAAMQVGAGAETLLDEVLSGKQYPPDEPGGSAAAALLERAIELWRARPSSRIALEVHDDDTGGKLQAQIRTARLAEALKRFLLARGVGEEAVEVRAVGANRPLDNTGSRRARALNRRVLVHVSAPPPALAQAGEAAHVRVAGADMQTAADGSFAGAVTVASDAIVTVDLLRQDGTAVIMTVPLYEGRPRQGGGEPPQGAPPSDGSPRLGLAPSTAPAFERTATVQASAVRSTETLVPNGGRLWLPPDGATLPGERVTVMGEVDAGSRVTVNGKSAAVDERGRFASTATLASGTSALEVRIERQDGATATITRSYHVPSSEWFLLALADGVAGRGPKVASMTEATSVDLPREIYLHGRAVAYFKGRIRGDALLSGLPFDDVRVTAHVDTGKERDPALLRQIIDPERYYPVYGDSTEEVQDVSSAGKAYLLIEADRSRATLGNFKTSLHGVELVRFERGYYGVALDVDEAFVPERHTEVHAWVASSAAGLAHRQLALQGTGGAMYFLKDDALVEGSERVSIVVRDATSGMLLETLPQARDRDYAIDYRNGRVVFTQPVPAVVTAGWRLQQNPVRTLDGHAVFVEIEYDHQAAVGEVGASARAVQVRQELNRFVTIGASAIDEDRGDAGGAHYRLFAGEARLHLPGNTTLEGEVAHSQAVDTEHWVSVDGGVTYGKVGRPERVDGRPPEGWAMTARASGNVANAPYTLYFQRQAPGFYSGANVFEQGQTKVGGQVRASLTEQDSVRLRHDGVWSALWALGERRTSNRQLSVAGYEHKRLGSLAGLELGHTYSDDGKRVINTDLASVYGERQVLTRLVLELQQQAIVRGDERVLRETSDRFATTVGARYQLGEKLWLTASESLRWSGTNSAQVGLRTELGEGLSMYASERWLAGTSRTVNTLVLGGESRAIPGSRSYAEYQLDGAASAQSGRAVFGMENNWTIASGLTLQLSYERAQLVGRDSAPYAAQAGYAATTPGVTGYGSGALASEQQFAASSYAAGGVFPVGVSSRDAMSVGFEFLGIRTLKLGSRFELRYDRGAKALGTPDRMTMYLQAGGDWRVERDLVLLGRLRGATVHNVDAPTGEGDVAGFTEAEFLDLSIGVALRPAHTQRYNALFKYTRRYERRPVVGLTQYQLEISDVVSLEPVVEIGWGLQAVGKVAAKLFQVVDADLPAVTSTTVLALLRLNYHVTAMLDAGAEYRWLANMLAAQVEQGALVEVSWLPRPDVAVGVGYNFSHFSDDLLVRAPRSDHGFFVRLTGRY
ncbi:MAG: hypothetical protein AAB426_11500 [Myxococcota bacterium]